MKPVRLWFLDTEVVIRVCEADGGDGVSVLEHFAPFADSPALHRHADEDEIFHVMSGTLRFVIDGREIEARAGETLHASKQLPHTYRVESRDGARWLTITAHGQFERFVRAFGSRPGPAFAIPRGRPSRSRRRRSLPRAGTTASRSWGHLCLRRRGNLRSIRFLCCRGSWRITIPTCVSGDRCGDAVGLATLHEAGDARDADKPRERE